MHILLFSHFFPFVRSRANGKKAIYEILCSGMQLRVHGFYIFVILCILIILVFVRITTLLQVT